MSEKLPPPSFQWDGFMEPPQPESPSGDTPETKATLRITEQLREAANFIESCHAANVDLLNRKGDLERRLHEAHDSCDRYAEQLQDALREVEEHKSRCTVLEAEVAEWKSQFAAALAEKGKA